MFLWLQKCLSVVLKYIQIVIASVIAKKSCVSLKMFEMEFKFSKLVDCLGVSESTKRLAAQSTA